MKTDDLVTMLATGAAAADPRSATRRYTLAIVLGIIASAVLMAGLLGIRPDLNAALWLPMFWVKLLFVATLGLTGAIAAERLSRPGTPLRWAPAVIAAPVIAMWALAAIVLASAGSGERQALIFGQTSAYCPLLVALLSAPIFAAAMWAMRGLAPTRLRLAGAAAGFASGALGAAVYALHCPEMAAPFIALWYLLGVLIPTGVGALLGPRLLRW